VPDPLDVLDKEKCLDALAALRHAKWFQVCMCSRLFCHLFKSMTINNVYIIVEWGVFPFINH